MTDNLQVTTRPTLISAPKMVTMEPGSCLADIVARQLCGGAVGAVLVEVNGVPVERERWEKFCPSPGDHVLVYTSVHGDEKNPLATIISIAIIAAASYIGGPAGGLGAYGALAATVVTTFGLFLVNKVLPPPKPPDPYTYNDSPTYSFSGARNAMMPWGPVSVVLGSHRHYAPLGAKVYTELVGNDEYVRMLLVWGYGPLKIEDLQIGDTPIDAFEAEAETVLGFPGESNDLSLFPSQVDQTAIGTLLSQASGWITRTAPAGADELSVEIWFNRGQVAIDEETSRRSSVTVAFDLQYAVVGSGVWHDLSGTINYAATDFISNNGAFGLFSGRSSVYANIDGTITLGSGTSERPLAKRIAEMTATFVQYTETSYGWTVTDLVNLSPAGVTGLAVTTDGQDISVALGEAVFDDIAYTAKSIELVRYGVRWPVDRAQQYEIRMRRVTADSSSDYTFDEATWQYLRGIICDPPLNFAFPVAATALRVKMTDQLSGAIDNVNAVCTSICPVWDGTDWDAWEPTSNPAALYRHVLTGDANPRPREVTQLEADDLADWFDNCVAAGYEFNMIRDFRASVRDTLADIAAAGMATVAMPNGKWSVVEDVFDKAVAQHFTPHNSWGFSAERLLIEHPHAVRVRFKNEDAGYEWDELIVYADGYTSANATLFEGWEFPGITSAELIYKFARRRMALVQLRPESYSFYADFEHIACRRGSLIRASHDVMLVGLGSGRIKSITAAGGNIVSITVDEKLTMAAGTTYCIRVRLVDGTSSLINIATVAGKNTVLTPDGVYADTATGEGDLFSFGERGSETGEYIVYSIESISDLAAKLTVVDYAPGIDTADSGPIPAHDSLITRPLDITRIAPAAPSIASTESGTRALELIGSTVRPRIIVTLAPALNSNVRTKEFTIRYRKTDAQVWRKVVLTSPEISAVLADGIEEGEPYIIQANAVGWWGAVSEWSAATTITVLGQSELPTDVTGFAANIVGTDAHLEWNAVYDLDLSHYRIRWSPATSGATWAESVDLIRRVNRDATSATVPAMVGTYLIKAVDRADNESANAAAAIAGIARVPGLNLVTTFSQADPAWSGSGTDASVSAVLGGIALDDPAAAAVGYYAFDGYIDLLAVYTSRLSAELTIGGQDLVTDLYDYADLYAVDDLYGLLQGAPYSVALQVASTEDDPAGAPTWSDWAPFIVGDLTFRAVKFRAVLTGVAPSITPILYAVSVAINMPDRVVGFTSAVGTGGASIAFTPAFYAVPEIGISVANGAEGDAYTITNLDETGFDIAFTNGGSAVARNISGVAKGYGELET